MQTNDSVEVWRDDKQRSTGKAVDGVTVVAILFGHLLAEITGLSGNGLATVCDHESSFSGVVTHQKKAGFSCVDQLCEHFIGEGKIAGTTDSKTDSSLQAANSPVMS